MAATNTPITATQTETQMDDTVQNPVTTTASATHGNVVTISLVFGPGINFDPAVIYDALDATYGTVASGKATLARGCYIFKIEA